MLKQAIFAFQTSWILLVLTSIVNFDLKTIDFLSLASSVARTPGKYDIFTPSKTINISNAHIYQKEANYVWRISFNEEVNLGDTNHNTQSISNGGTL